jgi:hypothetical protein
MQLLVSVTDGDEARRAVRRGADVVDAKDPRLGPLGPVALETFREIHAAVGGTRPVSAALGDARDEAALAHTARDFAGAGSAFVKVGFAGISEVGRIRTLLSTTVGATRDRNPHTGVVAVAYADADRAGSLGVPAILEAARAARAAGLLVDTADKAGPGLTGIVDGNMLRSWIEAAHAAGLFAAVAGRLGTSDFSRALDAGADIVGVRGAACVGGRTGRVSDEHVRALRALCSPVVRA